MAEQGTGPPKTVGPGTASGPPPLGNEASLPEGEVDGRPAPSQGTTPDNPRPSTATFPIGGSDLAGEEAYLYMGLGVGLLFLVGLGFLWSRGQQSDLVEDIPDGVIRLSEGPFLAPSLPSLSDGLQVWTVSPDDHAALLADLLTTLADSHRVLVVSPSDVVLPQVAGGPVYRVDGMRPVHLENPVDTLVDDGGRWPCLLFAVSGSLAAALPDFADSLPAGVGGVALLSESVDLPFPQVAVERTEHGWTLSLGALSRGVTRTRDGRLVALTGQMEA